MPKTAKSPAARAQDKLADLEKRVKALEAAAAPKAETKKASGSK